MTTSRAPFAGPTLIAALCASLIFGLTTPAWAGWDEAVAAAKRGDYATAIREFFPLAEQGHAKAQYNVGHMYRNGHGVPQDYAEAMRWYRKAADQGLARAQNNLGFMYYTSLGVPQDYIQAHLWFNLAASRMPPGEARDRAFKNRNIVAEGMTSVQITEAQKLAREWRPK